MLKLCAKRGSGQTLLGLVRHRRPFGPGGLLSHVAHLYAISTQQSGLPGEDSPSDRLVTAKQIIEKYSKQVPSESSNGMSAEVLHVQGTPPDSDNDPAFQKALSRALRLVNYRERSAKELRSRLEDDGHPDLLAQAVVAKLQAMGLQDDARFAEAYAHNKWKTNAVSPKNLKYELQSKHGITREHVQQALESVFGVGSDLTARAADADPDQAQEEAWTLLLERAGRHAEATKRDPPEKRRAKMVRWLQYRGHSWKTVKQVLDHLGL